MFGFKKKPIEPVEEPQVIQCIFRENDRTGQSGYLWTVAEDGCRTDYHTVDLGGLIHDDLVMAKAIADGFGIKLEIIKYQLTEHNIMSDKLDMIIELLKT